MFYNDRPVRISTGNSRKATLWVEQQLFWSDFVTKLSEPVRTTESFATYKSLPKAKQDELKDIGGYVGGVLTGGRRKNDNAGPRDLITLDADTIEPGGTQRVLTALTSLGCAYAVYSTRKHEGAAPRLRIIFPLDRSCDPDEYEPIARKMASFIDMNIFDPTTFETVRLMYWPSCSADSEFIFVYEDKPFLSADGILGLYQDWRNVAEWPEVPGAAKIRDRSAKKQGDPLEKKGVVGAFCRLYSIEQAMAEFIPGEYTECAESGRYTYTGGSTVGGAVVYDGKFLYSHHATDPCSGRLCNAFDMVRLHLFGDEDAETLPETPVTSLPSYKKMSEYALGIPQISQELMQERYMQAAEAFSRPMTAGQEPEDMNWMNRLQINTKTGIALSTTENICIILENDPALKGKWYLDDFMHRILVVRPLPWELPENFKPRPWCDNDDGGLRHHLEKYYSIVGIGKVSDAYSEVTNKKRYNKLKDYLTRCQWDGVPRIDTLLIDYFGAEDTSYTRNVIRKTLTAAVARVFMPGTKFDCMLILSGKQGLGKSTFFRMLGLEWFSDSLTTLEGKDAMEQVQGCWIIEVGELDGFNRSEMNAVKNFLSKQEDQYREPYGKRKSYFPRQCIIVGTTNETDFLKDRTGNRRFWPVDLGKTVHTKDVWRDLPGEIPLIWAEAVQYYMAGEPLYLTGDAEQEALKQQEGHKIDSVKEGMIRDFLDIPITADWYKKSPYQRRMDLQSGMLANAGIRRDKICIAEIWNECFSGDYKLIKPSDIAEIGGILNSMEGWERLKSNARFGTGYGTQKGYRRVSTDDTR